MAEKRQYVEILSDTDSDIIVIGSSSSSSSEIASEDDESLPVVPTSAKPVRFVISIDVGLVNCGVAVAEMGKDSNQPNLKVWERLTLLDAKAKRTPAIVSNVIKDLIDQLLQQLQCDPSELGVIVENQISFRQRSKSAMVSYKNGLTATAFYAHFQGMGVSCHGGSPKYVSNVMKLSGDGTRKLKAKRKVSDILENGEIIHIPQEMKAKYKSEKKKDDLADSLLQLLAYLSKFTKK
jgi:hypothetical protein